MQRQQSGGRTRAILAFGVSVLLGLIAAVLVYQVVQKNREELNKAVAKQKEVIDVVIASRDLYMGLPIGPDDIVVRQVSPDMVQRENTFASLTDVLGRTPRERILANESVRDERLARPDAGIGLNAIVTPGKRGMTVATNTETAVAGLLQAGNYVDIIVTIKPEDPSAAGAKWVTDTILQGIKVLAVGSNLGGNEGKEEEKKGAKKPTEPTKRMKPSITLEVTPEEAEKLALAVSQGEIHVVLRSDIDITQWDTHGVMTNQKLIGYEARPAATGEPRTPRPDDTPPAEEPPQLGAQVIQGSKSTDYVIGAGGSVSDKNKKK